MYKKVPQTGPSLRCGVNTLEAALLETIPCSRLREESVAECTDVFGNAAEVYVRTVLRACFNGQRLKS